MIAPEIAATTGRQIPTDVVFSTLSNPRRRHVLHYLKRSDGPVAIGDLAEALAAWENGRSVEEVTSKERKRVYTSLYQSHLPKMHRDGVVSYDAPRGVVELTPAAAQLDIHMEVVDANDIPWSQFYLGLSALSAAVVLALWVGIYPLTLVSTLGWLTVFSVLFVASAAVHAYSDRRTRLGSTDLPLDLSRRAGR